MKEQSGSHGYLLVDYQMFMISLPEFIFNKWREQEQEAAPEVQWWQDKVFKLGQSVFLSEYQIMESSLDPVEHDWMR